MTKLFGELATIRGIAIFRLSPYEQKTFVGFFSRLARAFRRTSINVVKVIPPLIPGYLMYSWTKETAAGMARKNPKDYENDV